MMIRFDITPVLVHYDGHQIVCEVVRYEVDLPDVTPDKITQRPIRYQSSYSQNIDMTWWRMFFDISVAPVDAVPPAMKVTEIDEDKEGRSNHVQSTILHAEFERRVAAGEDPWTVWKQLRDGKTFP